MADTLKSVEDLKKAIELVQRFHDENSERDARMLLGGRMPDMVDALLGTSQLSVLAWLLPEEVAAAVCPKHVGMFDETLSRLRQRYGG